MSKRVAGRELNHDNWDQEEEEEEAGTFQRATDNEIKGRVIKKAKRRNLDGDKKTNVFSGFAFASTATSKPAENAFSFLSSKPADDSAAAKDNKPSFGSFVFGSSSKKPAEDSAAKPFGGFVFGKPKLDDDTTKDEDVKEGGLEKENGAVNGGEKRKDNVDNDKDLSKFMKTTSTWTCQTCMVSNPEDKNKCVCCETKKPVTDSSADQTADSNNTKSNLSQFHTKSSPKEETKVNGGFNFAGTSLETKSSEGKWSCDVCMIQNNSDAIKCLACETLKPGATISEAASKDEPKMTFGANGGFSFAGTALQTNSAQSKQWTCDVCMIRNNEDLVKCLACETMKPGSTITEKEKSPVKMSFGASGGFKFGGSTTDTNSTQPATTGGFTFGQAATSTPEPTPEGGGFKFGSGTGGFKFGSTEKESKESSGGFTFGSTEKESKESAIVGFKFGSTEKESKESAIAGFNFGSNEKESKESAIAGFKFGSNEKESKDSAISGFKFGSNEKESEKSSGGGFKFGSTEKESKQSSGGGFKFGSTEKDSDDDSGEGEGLKFEFTKTSDKKTDSSSSGFKIGSDCSTPSTPLGFKFGAQTNNSLGSVFGAPRGPFGTPAGEKTGHQTPSKLAAGSKKAEYLGQIKALNLQVTSLINKHIDTNALVDLSPVFVDYQKHINNIRTKYEVQPKCQSNGTSLSTNGTSEVPSKQGEEKEVVTGDEVFEHKEENSFFSTKCKLFLKKDNKYEEHGKGYVHLKKGSDTAYKTQLVIRCDNALGTILLNIMVDSARIEKVGDNNILLATIPNPPIPGEESGPATFLIRVKKEVRDEMFGHLQKE